MNDKRVVVAMSGGVDSSVAAAILKHEGYDVVGITMKTWGFMEVGGAPKHESGCCSLDAIYDAKNVADSLGFPHYTVDFTRAFEEAVIDNFVDEYMHGRTPNPCVICNKKIKWEELLKKADAIDARYVATGHYAISAYDTETGRYCIRNPKDSHKDQTYALWGLTQESLSRTIFPLGKYTKPEVRELAEKYNLKTANKPDSQEICFVADNDYQRFLLEKRPELAIEQTGGDIIMDGEKIGRHKGIPFYTIGQRKGIGLALGKPAYVTKIDYNNNVIEIGEKKDLLKKELYAGEINYVSRASLSPGDKVLCKIRYSDKGSPAEILAADSNSIHLRFYEGKSAITPGQSAVIYDETGNLLAGGVISQGN
ncbi:MAG: tRNA 2-thiouridine(34) synthase MnmA [Syntrophothermus sp.]